MRLAQSFDAIETGEVDDFAFNVSTRLGQAQIVSGSVVGRCQLVPFSNGADLDPGSRIQAATFSNNGVYYRDVSGIVQFIPGVFTIIRLGPCPASAAGGTYMLGYQAFLSDGRIIQDNTTVACVLPGQ